MLTCLCLVWPVVALVCLVRSTTSTVPTPVGAPRDVEGPDGCTASELYLGQFQLIGSITVPESALPFYTFDPDDLDPTAVPGSRRLLSWGSFWRGAAKTVSSAIPFVGPVVSSAIDAEEDGKLQDEISGQAARIEDNLRSIAANKHAIAKNSNDIAMNADSIADLQLVAMELATVVQDQINFVVDNMNTRFRTVRASIFILAERVHLLELQQAANRQYSVRRNHLARNAKILGSLLSDPPLRKFFQIASLAELRHLSAAEPYGVPSLSGKPLVLFFLRLFVDTERDPSVAQPFTPFTGRVCRMTVRRVHSPVFFLRPQEAPYFLESHPVCFLLDTQACLAAPSTPSATACAGPLAGLDIFPGVAAVHPCERHTGAAPRSRAVDEVVIDLLSYCLQNKQLHPDCDRCDPRTRWHQAQNHRQPDLARARAPNHTAANGLFGRACFPSQPCTDGQGTCTADTDCVPPSSCQLCSQLVGAWSGGPWLSQDRCCVNTPARACDLTGTTNTGYCCDTGLGASRCGLEPARPDTAPVLPLGQGGCLYDDDCAGALECSRSSCNPVSAPGFHNLQQLKCCWDPAEPPVPTTSPDNWATVGDGFTVFSSDNLGANADDDAERVDFAGLRGVYPGASFAPRPGVGGVLGQGRPLAFATLFFDPNQLCAQGTPNYTPVLHPDTRALWDSGGRQPNLALAVYGPMRVLEVGAHVHTGDTRVLHPAYTQSSDALLGFVRGDVALHGWTPDFGDAQAVPPEDRPPLCRSDVSPAGVFHNVCCRRATFPGVVEATGAGHSQAATELLGLRTVLVETRGLLDLASAQAGRVRREFEDGLDALRLLSGQTVNRSALVSLLDRLAIISADAAERQARLEASAAALDLIKAARIAHSQSLVRLSDTDSPASSFFAGIEEGLGQLPGSLTDVGEGFVDTAGNILSVPFKVMADGLKAGEAFFTSFGSSLVAASSTDLEKWFTWVSILLLVSLLGCILLMLLVGGGFAKAGRYGKTKCAACARRS
jgi:hypothetical protein